MLGRQAPFRLPLPARNVYEDGTCRPRAAPESTPFMVCVRVLNGPHPNPPARRGTVSCGNEHAEPVFDAIAPRSDGWAAKAI